MKKIVGKIDNQDVIYIPEKDLVFCKNTVVPLDKILEALSNGLSINEIEDKNLKIIKENNIIHLGCLTTTLDNCNKIKRNISKIKHYGNR